MVIRSQAEAIKLLEKENKHLKDLQKNMDQQYEKLESNWNALKEILDNTLYKLNGILDRDLLEEQMLLDYVYIRNKIQELEKENEQRTKVKKFRKEKSNAYYIQSQDKNLVLQSVAFLL